MYERFTDRARRVMQLANQEAHRLTCTFIGTEHLLLALCKEGSGVAALALTRLGVDIRKIILAYKSLYPHAESSAIVIGRLPHTPPVKLAINNAIEESRTLAHYYVCTEHILLGLLRVPECASTAILTAILGNDALAKVRAEVMLLLRRIAAKPATIPPAHPNRRPIASPIPHSTPDKLRAMRASLLATIAEIDALIATFPPSDEPDTPIIATPE